MLFSFSYFVGGTEFYYVALAGLEFYVDLADLKLKEIHLPMSLGFFGLF